MPQNLSFPAIITLLNGKLSALNLRFSKILPRHAKDIYKDLYNEVTQTICLWCPQCVQWGNICFEIVKQFINWTHNSWICNKLIKFLKGNIFREMLMDLWKSQFQCTKWKTERLWLPEDKQEYVAQKGIMFWLLTACLPPLASHYLPVFLFIWGLDVLLFSSPINNFP